MAPKRSAKIDVFTDELSPSSWPTRNSKRLKTDPDRDSKLDSRTSPPRRLALGDKTKASNSRDTSRARRNVKEASPKSSENITIKSEHHGLSQPKSHSKTEFSILVPKLSGAPATDIEAIKKFSTKGAHQEAADLISRKGLWTPDTLSEFSNTSITKLDLSSDPVPSGGFIIPKFPPSQLLAPLFALNSFASLTTITLRNTIVSSDDIGLLRLLSSLEFLDLCATGINNTALYYLVCHRHTLKVLNIANNEHLTDDIRPAFSTFVALKALYLRGTNLTMPSIRRLAMEDLPKDCRLLSIPQQAINILNSRDERYCVDIPDGYVTEPERVGFMQVPALKRNLELHAKSCKEVLVTGTKLELVQRLRTLLKSREADEKIMSILGRASA